MLGGVNKPIHNSNIFVYNTKKPPSASLANKSLGGAINAQ